MTRDGPGVIIFTNLDIKRHLNDTHHIVVIPEHSVANKMTSIGVTGTLIQSRRYICYVDRFPFLTELLELGKIDLDIPGSP